MQSKKKFIEFNFSNSNSNNSKSSQKSLNANNINPNFPNKKSSKVLASMSKDVKVYVKILSHGCWPIEKLIEKQMPNIPTLLDNHMSEFTEYYDQKYKNRTLKWIHDLSWAEIKAQYKDATYSFIVSSIQMSILDIFNRFSQITIHELIKELGMNITCFNSIKPEIAHLISSEVLINDRVRKNYGLGYRQINITNDLFIDDILIVNNKFSSNNSKIILQYKSETKVKRSMSEEISHFVLEDRKFQIESIIMKILKTHKKLEFEILKDLIFKGVQNFFVPEISMIKNRLDSLVDRLLVNEEAKNPSVYSYC